MKRKTVIITGASKGIGRSIALEFGRQGWNVWANCREDKEALLNVKVEIEKNAGHCACFLGDISCFETAKEMIDGAISEFGQIDCLINNAGISYIGLLTDMRREDWDHIINTNLGSVFNCCQNIIPHMLHQKAGKIINISSVWGEAGASCEVAYSASKGGMNAFTKALAKELAPSSIQVNALSCGAIDTHMNAFLDEEEKKTLMEEIPAGRLGTPEEIAQMVYHLACAPEYLTGQIIRMDGGWL